MRIETMRHYPTNELEHYDGQKSLHHCYHENAHCRPHDRRENEY